MDAVKVTRDCDVIFLDPDNGVECRSIKRTYMKGPKYVCFDEMKKFLSQGKSLIVYQHLDRKKHELQLKNRSEEIQKHLEIKPLWLRYRRGTSRVFFIIPSSDHRNQFQNSIDKLLNSDWGKDEHFTK